MLASVITWISVGVCLLYVTVVTLQLGSLFYPTLQIPYYSDPIPTPEYYHTPYYSAEQLYSLSVYLTRSIEDTPDLTKVPTLKVEQLDIRRLDRQLKLPLKLSEVGKNGTVAAHFYLFVGLNLNNDGLKQVRKAWLTRLAPLESDKKRLLMEEKADWTSKETLVYHLSPSLRVQFVADRTAYPNTFLPGDIAHRMLWVQQDNYPYLPIFDVDPFSAHRGSQIPLSDTASLLGQDELEVTLELKTTSLGWFRLVRMLEANFYMMTRPGYPLRVSQEEANQFRKMVAETDPTLLGFTILAAVLHLLFEWLAFKEDVQHWRALKTMAGVSRTAVILDALSRVVAVAYLKEKREETSILVLGGALISAAVALWKVYRAYERPVINQSEQELQDDKISRDVDRSSTRTIIVLAIPVAIAYSVHSLYYRSHTGMHAWALDALMMLVYLLGFVTMTPQLFLNYRLKSVEAMPIKVFMYRTLNTVVDDLFALVIPMPWLTRLAAFRDDIVFVILLWQWWCYPKRKPEQQEEKQKTD